MAALSTVRVTLPVALTTTNAGYVVVPMVPVLLTVEPVAITAAFEPVVISRYVPAGTLLMVCVAVPLARFTGLKSYRGQVAASITP